MSSIPHIGFIVAAYGVTVVVLGATIAALVLDGRTQQRMLARLEARTSRRAGTDRGKGERA